MIRVAICDDMPEFLHATETLVAQWENKPDDLYVETFGDGDALINAHIAKPGISFLHIRWRLKT